MCGSEPSFAWAEIVPWFCPNEDCQVFAWDPYSSASQNLAAASTVVVTEQLQDDTPTEPPAPSP
jgi:hypothetical protein